MGHALELTCFAVDGGTARCERAQVTWHVCIGICSVAIDRDIGGVWDGCARHKVDDNVGAVRCSLDAIARQLKKLLVEENAGCLIVGPSADAAWWYGAVAGAGWAVGKHVAAGRGGTRIAAVSKSGCICWRGRQLQAVWDDIVLLDTLGTWVG